MVKRSDPGSVKGAVGGKIILRMEQQVKRNMILAAGRRGPKRAESTYGNIGKKGENMDGPASFKGKIGGNKTGSSKTAGSKTESSGIRKGSVKEKVSKFEKAEGNAGKGFKPRNFGQRGQFTPNRGPQNIRRGGSQ